MNRVNGTINGNRTALHEAWCLLSPPPKTHQGFNTLMLDHLGNHRDLLSEKGMDSCF